MKDILNLNDQFIQQIDDFKKIWRYLQLADRPNEFEEGNASHLILIYS